MEKQQMAREFQAKAVSYIDMANRAQDEVVAALFREKAAYFMGRITEVMVKGEDEVFVWRMGREIARGRSILN